MLLRKVAAALLLAAVVAIPARAQNIVISDCRGFTRAAQNINPGSITRVEVQVSGGAAGQPGGGVTLTNVGNGAVSHAQIAGGTAVFNDVEPGAYILGADDDVSLDVVIIGAGGVGLGAAAAALGAAVVGGGGAVTGAVIGIHEATSGGSNHRPVPSATPAPTPQPTGTPSRRPTPSPTLDDCACDPNARPTPLDQGDFTSEGNPISPAR